MNKHVGYVVEGSGALAAIGGLALTFHHTAAFLLLAGGALALYVGRAIVNGAIS